MEAFTQHTKGNAHIVIVSHSSTAILAGLPPASMDATRDFKKSGFADACDLTSIASVKRLAASLEHDHERGAGGVDGAVVLRAVGEDARVMAVFTAGQGKELDLSDLGPTWYKDYAARNPGITFIHAYPGLVDTPLLKNVPLTSDILATAKSIEVCGEHQLYTLLKASAGASRTGQDGDDIGMDLPATEEVQRTLWEHTEEVIGAIE
ncbi:NAD(P)-binding protein [Mycena leptocephala]|nr:NAD(P)-binding protein [Mycena leptocephala]